jgi:hypothetical protein
VDVLVCVGTLPLMLVFWGFLLENHCLATHILLSSRPSPPITIDHWLRLNSKFNLVSYANLLFHFYWISQAQLELIVHAQRQNNCGFVAAVSDTYGPLLFTVFHVDASK